ncbi:MAG: acyl carrier protein [Atopobiaceae bacterium]|nr:acyl carrier protein [Atopobiaceae bacterium]MCR4870174.1 acyl carrier protein [Atopobiaceae bacterium]
MDRTAILERVVEIVLETLDVEDGIEIDEETSFKSLGADSFELLELVTTMEDEFDLTFDDEALEAIATVRDAVDAIEGAQ